MYSYIDKLTVMFSKIIAGTLSREEGAMLINHLAKEDRNNAIVSLTYLIENPPHNVFQTTMLHTIALAKNKAFFNLIAQSINSRDEDVSSLAAQELARLRTEGAKNTLIKNLNNDTYHVRKSAAVALAEDYGEEGMEILKNHILTHEEPFYRATSAQGLIAGGDSGITMLFSILHAETPGPVFSAAEAITSIEDEIKEDHLPVAMEALMEAGDRRDMRLVVELLKVAALFKKKALKYEPIIQAFADDPSESIRLETKKTLSRIRRAF